MPRRCGDRRPCVVGERHAILHALRFDAPLRLARHKNFRDPLRGLCFFYVAEIALNFAVKKMRGIEALGIDVNREHAVGETAALRPRGAGPRERATDELADQSEAGSLMFAERTDRAFAFR